MLAIILVLLFAAILLGLLRAIDYEALRTRPRGLVSLRGLALIVGGGILLGFAYGVATADEGGLNWLERGLTVGLITGSGGAFWLGFQQRHQ